MILLSLSLRLSSTSFHPMLLSVCVRAAMLLEDPYSFMNDMEERERGESKHEINGILMNSVVS